MPPIVKPRNDDPFLSTSYTDGQEDFMRGRPLRKKYDDQYRQNRYEEGYSREKVDWEMRPRLV